MAGPVQMYRMPLSEILLDSCIFSMEVFLHYGTNTLTDTLCVEYLALEGNLHRCKLHISVQFNYTVYHPSSLLFPEKPELILFSPLHAPNTQIEQIQCRSLMFKQAEEQGRNFRDVNYTFIFTCILRQLDNRNMVLPYTIHYLLTFWP